jgi:hypothetical protein
LMRLANRSMFKKFRKYTEAYAAKASQPEP